MMSGRSATKRSIAGRGVGDLRQARTFFLVAGFYVIIGLTVAATSAVKGDRIAAFLGFLIVSGALASAALYRAILRVTSGFQEWSERIDGVRRRLDQLETSLTARLGEIGTAATAGTTAWVDLTTIGKGNPAPLAAATLDRDVYPRLVTAMDKETRPTDEPNEREPPRILPFASEDADPARIGSPARPDDLTDGPATKDLLRQWKVAVRDGDLAVCRAVHSTLIDVVEPDELRPIEAQMEALADRVEASLREAFSRHIRNREFVEAMGVGEQIVRLLPERGIAVEFERIFPLLQRRARGSTENSAAAVRQSVR